MCPSGMQTERIWVEGPQRRGLGELSSHAFAGILRGLLWPVSEFPGERVQVPTSSERFQVKVRHVIRGGSWAAEWTPWFYAERSDWGWLSTTYPAVGLRGVLPYRRRIWLKS